jgi:hypothetical protein
MKEPPCRNLKIQTRDMKSEDAASAESRVDKNTTGEGAKTIGTETEIRTVRAADAWVVNMPCTNRL